MTSEAKHNLLDPLSLASRGLRVQFAIAVTLISVLPVLTLLYLMRAGAMSASDALLPIWLIVCILSSLSLLGYALLMRYPSTISRLLKQMRHIAAGEIPDHVDLLKGERNIAAVEECLNTIVHQMRTRIATIQLQQEELMEAERQKVMLESLCAACHHISQPATMIMCRLELLKGMPLPPAAEHQITDCLGAARRLQDALSKLQNTREYEASSYLPNEATDTSQPFGIIEIDGE